MGSSVVATDGHNKKLLASNALVPQQHSSQAPKKALGAGDADVAGADEAAVQQADEVRGPAGKPDEEVLVVAASLYALKEYLELGVYFCQPERRFRPVSRMAFYAHGRIDQHVPLVLSSVESVIMSEEGVRASPDLGPGTRKRLLALVAHWQKTGRGGIGEPHKVVFLSRATSAQTLKLPREIPNDKLDKNGETTAFTQKQYYVMLSALLAGPRTTSELLGLAGTGRS